MAEMDAKYCVVQFGNKTRIFTLMPSTVFPGSFEPAFYDYNSMSMFFMNSTIVVQDADGNSVRKAIFPFWMRRAQRPTAQGLIFDTSGERIINGQLNLWSGLAWSLRRVTGH